MKIKFHFLLAMLLISVALASCSSDDDDKVGNTTNKEAQIFIGKWSGYYTWEFKEDGTCVYITNSKTVRGTWKYEADSKTLITDVLEWNWKIISLSQDMWVGKHLAGSQGTFTYTRIKE